MAKQAGETLIAAVMATADAFLRESQRLFRPLGLTAAQYNVLNVLAGRTDGLSQRELSEHLVVDRSNVTGLLDRLEKTGWVRRTDHPADRRIYQVVLTPAGRRQWARVAPRYAAAAAEVTRGLSARQAAACQAMLQILESSAGAWAGAKPRVRKKGFVSPARSPA
jgi:DNA-binding MarR family transcriptional regulator